MTIFLQVIRPAKRNKYWTAWVDPAGNGSGIGRTEGEAIGNLILLLAKKENGEVELRYQPTIDYREGQNGGVS